MTISTRRTKRDADLDLAQSEISTSFLGVVEKYDLTAAEVTKLLVETTARWAARAVQEQQG